jgi:hypothetical protein
MTEATQPEAEDKLPAAYETVQDNRIYRETKPTYRLNADCPMIWTNQETGIAGPSLVLAGTTFVSDDIPNAAWEPMNAAAQERVQAWMDSLPTNTHFITLEDITEAAHMLRPREGEADIPHEQFQASMMRLAAQLADKRRGRLRRSGAVGAIGFRPTGAGYGDVSPMPFMSANLADPGMVGRAPPNAAQTKNPKAAKAVTGQRPPQPIMPGT